MKEIETGIFKEIYPFIIKRGGTKNIVLFPQSGDLFWFIKVNGRDQINLLSKFIPEEYNIHIIGYDPNFPEDTDPIEVVKDFAEFIREKVGKTTILAISFGGLFAIPFAAIYPDLTEKLVLMMCAYKASEQGKEWAKRQIKMGEQGKIFEVLKEQEDLYNKKIFRILFKIIDWISLKKNRDTMNPISTFINGYKLILRNEGNDEFLGKIKAPTYIFGGTKDLVFSKELYEETISKISNGKLILFEGAGHMLPVEKMKSFKKTIKEIL